jgi:hypothetical protein
VAAACTFIQGYCRIDMDRFDWTLAYIKRGIGLAEWIPFLFAVTGANEFSIRVQIAGKENIFH